MSSTPPVCLALLVCDAVWRDPATGKHTLLGCFSAIGAHQFPVIHPQLAVYLALTDGYDSVPLELRLIDADEKALTTTTLEVQFGDPLAVVEIAVHLTEVTFPSPGRYRLQLTASGTPLMERRFGVHGHV